MNMSISGNASHRLTLVSVLVLVLLGLILSCQKKGPGPFLTTTRNVPFPVCTTITITPGSKTVRPSVDVDACTVAPNQTITWVCSTAGCDGWQVIFDDPNVQDAMLFQNRSTTFYAGQPTATLVNTLVPQPNVPIIVKYKVKNASGQIYDPHIVPMTPSP